MTETTIFLNELLKDPVIKLFLSSQESSSLSVINFRNGNEIVITVDKFIKCSYDVATCSEEYYYLLITRNKDSKRIIEKNQYFFTKQCQQVVCDCVIKYVATVCTEKY